MILPNLITIGRLLAVPAAVVLIGEGALAAAFWLFMVAGLSDAVDGLIAKRFGAETEFGRYLDPLADKALLVGVYVALGIEGSLPNWLVILVVSRDILIVGGFVLTLLVAGGYRVRPSYVSKVNTAAQIVLAALVLGTDGGVLPAVGLELALIYVVAATTLLSGAGYLIAWGREFFAREEGAAEGDSGGGGARSDGDGKDCGGRV